MMDFSNSFIQGVMTVGFSVISLGLSIWLRNLNATIEKLRDGQVNMREIYQLKSDAVRDQEQIMSMLSEIKQSLERMNERIDRRTDNAGGR